MSKFQLAWGGSGNDELMAVRASGSGFVAAGQIATMGAGSGDDLVMRLDDCGSVVWAKTYGGGGKDSLTWLEPTGDGGWIAAGQSTSGDPSGDAWVVKLGDDGTKQWGMLHGGSGYDLAQSVVPAVPAVVRISETCVDWRRRMQPVPHDGIS